jgi:hypothetical protein
MSGKCDFQGRDWSGHVMTCTRPGGHHGRHVGSLGATLTDIGGPNMAGFVT